MLENKRLSTPISSMFAVKSFSCFGCLLIVRVTQRIVTALGRVPWDTFLVFQHIARCFHRRSRGEAAASVYRNVITCFDAGLGCPKEALKEICDGTDRYLFVPTLSGLHSRFSGCSEHPAGKGAKPL